MMPFPRLVVLALLGLWSAVAPALRAQGPAAGTLDPDFPAAGADSRGPDAPVRAVAVQPADGKILVAGEFIGVNGVTSPLVARLFPDGSLDPSFGNTRLFPTGTVNALTIQSDGKILLGGLFYRTTDGALLTVARLKTDGTLDPAFNATGTTDLPVVALAPASSGGVIVGGGFSVFGGQKYAGLVRLKSDGSVDATGFDPGTGTDGGTVNALARLSDGRLLVGGSFTSFNGVTRPGLVRLKSDGTVDTGFSPVNPAIAGAVLALLPVQTGGSQPNGVLLARANGTIQRLTGTGASDPAFTGVGFVQGGNVNALAVDDQGRILLGGGFTRYGITPRRGLARLLPDGTLDATFNPGLGVDAPVRALALGTDGGLVLGGDFSTVAGVSRPFLARVFTGPPAAGTVQFDAASLTVGEGAGTLTVRVNRLGGTRGAVSVPVTPTLAGTAGEGVDYNLVGDGTVRFEDGEASGTLTVSILNNPTPQPDRTFTLTLNPPTGGAALGTPASVTVTILDDDFPPAAASVTIQATTPTASAATNAKGVFTLTRTGGDPSLPALTVSYKVKGTAVGGVDYRTLPGVVTFPDGAATVKVKVKALPFEAGYETTVQLKLAGGSGYGLGSPVKATVTVGP